MKKASWFNNILSLGREYKHTNNFKMKHLPYLTWTEVTESDSG